MMVQLSSSSLGRTTNRQPLHPAAYSVGGWPGPQEEWSHEIPDREELSEFNPSSPGIRLAQSRAAAWRASGTVTRPFRPVRRLLPGSPKRGEAPASSVSRFRQRVRSAPLVQSQAAAHPLPAPETRQFWPFRGPIASAFGYREGGKRMLR
jgi:hypothetical protein